MTRCFGSELNKMNLFVQLSILSFMVFFMQIKFGVGQVATPWGSTQLAEDFITNFLRIIASSTAFSSNQLDEMSSIRKTLTTAMENFSNSNISSKIKFQALNMVFASAMAEITAEGGIANIQLKIDAIESALHSAYVDTMGEVNVQFVNDIKSLIYTLAHTAAKGVSTESFSKVGEYRQGSLKQQESPTSDKTVRINNSTPQRELRPEQELSNLESSLALNVPGDYVSILPFMTRLKRPSLQTPYEQQAKESSATLNTKKNLQGPPKFKPQESSPKGITSVQDQKGIGDYGASIFMPPEGSLISEHIKEESSNQERSRTIDKSDGDIVIASKNYGADKIAVGLQGTSVLEGKGLEIQQSSKTGTQESGGKKTAASFTIDKDESSRDAQGLIERGSLGSRDYQQKDLQSSVTINPRSEGFEPNYEQDAATPASDRMRNFKSVPNRGEPQESQGPIGKVTVGSNGYGSRVVATVVTDNYESGTGLKRSRPEEQDVHGPFRKEKKYEREMLEKVPSRQRLDIREPYEAEYQEANHLEGQRSDVNLPVTAGKYESGGGASPFGLGSSIQKASEVENLTENSGLNVGEHRTGAIVATTAVGYESTNDTKGLHGLGSNGPESEERNSYASGFEAAVNGFDMDRPIRVSRISNPVGNSEISSIASSLASGILFKSPAIANSSAPQVNIANPSLSNCKVLIKQLLDIISTFVHLLGSLNIGQFPDVSSTLYASVTGQSETKPIS